MRPAETRLQEAAARLMVTAGLPAEFQATPLPGGANNRVFRLDYTGGHAILKDYFYHENDRRDRLGAEFAFAQFAWDRGLRSLPRPLATDAEARYGLYEYIDGRPLDAKKVDSERVAEAARFFLDLNATRDTEDARRLADASEACFSITDHLKTVSRRIGRLHDIAADSAENRDALTFVQQVMEPSWRRLEQKLSQTCVTHDIDPDQRLEKDERCLSPSDFGFHNALVSAADGRLRFIDFEYAGWDDRAKLVGDFFNQVAVPVPMRYYDEFRDALASGTARPERTRQRIDLLLPVYRFKWVCIVLNDFLPVGEKRRRFSLADKAFAERKYEQLDKARRSLRIISEKK